MTPEVEAAGHPVAWRRAAAGALPTLGDRIHLILGPGAIDLPEDRWATPQALALVRIVVAAENHPALLRLTGPSPQAAGADVSRSCWCAAGPTR